MPHVVLADSESLQFKTMLLLNKNLQIAFLSLKLHGLPSYSLNTKRHTWALKAIYYLRTTNIRDIYLLYLIALINCNLSYCKINNY